VVNPVFRSNLRPWLSLDGEWDFALDPEEVGEQEKWFAGEKPFSMKVHVPGAWESQEIGQPGPSQPTTPEHVAIPLRHEYVGSAWYRKTFRLGPEWKGKLLWLKIGGVNSQGWFWVNGKSVGHLDPYCGTFKFDITPLVKDGENTIVARVSNKVTSRKGLLNWLDQFGGLYRSVEVEATSASFIDDVWVRSDFDQRRAIVQVQLASPRAVARDYRLLIKTFTLDGKPAGQAEVAVNQIQDTGTEISVPVDLDPFRPWSPEYPSLYRAEVSLQQYGRAVDDWVERFGVRKLERRGSDIYLNGKRYFLRGFGDDYIYPMTISSPASREVHKKHLELARSYGFNYVRNHTHVENPEYYQAAEEAGILIQPELPYYGSLPSSYASYAPLMDLNELIRHYRRFVSLATYSMGNEGLHEEQLREPLFRFAKLLDPSRLVVHQDGATNYEGISDFRGGPVNTPVQEQDVLGSMPVVLHEYLNLTAAPDVRLEPLFTGAQTSPYHLQEEKERAERLGVSWEMAERCIKGGHELQSIYQKLGLEQARSVAALDGYDYWTIADIDPFRPQGLLDMFWGLKRSSPEYFRQFNSATVLLLPDLSALGGDRVFVSGAKVSQRIASSNFSENAISPVRISWAVTAAGRTELQGRLEDLTIPQGTVSQLGRVEFTMPAVSHPTEVKLRTEIEGAGVQNEWSFYCFPEHWAHAELTKAFASTTVYEQLHSVYPGLQPSSPSAGKRPGREDLLITEQLDEEALKYLESGGKVLLLSLADLSPLKPGMRFGWWTPNNQRGTAMATSEAFGNFPSEEGLPSFAIFNIFREAVVLKGKLADHVDPLVITLGLDGYSTSVFQARVGAGKLFASGFDLLSDKPEAKYLLDQFAKYVQSSRFEPKQDLSVADLRLIVRGPAQASTERDLSGAPVGAR
jgi:hypothetical protein